MRKMIIAIALISLLAGCRASRAYKVTFTDGTTDYYELDYRPKKGAKYIVSGGETIIGVESIEKVK